MAKNFE